MNAPELAIALSSFSLFREVEPEHLLALCERAPCVTHPAGSALFTEGEPSDGVALLLVRGKAAASVRRGRDKRLLGESLPGELVGEVGLLVPGAPRTSTLTARTAVVALRVDMDLLDELFANPAVVALEAALLSSMSERIRRTTDAITGVWADERPDQAAPGGILSKLAGIFGRRA